LQTQSSRSEENYRFSTALKKFLRRGVKYLQSPELGKHLNKNTEFSRKIKHFTVNQH
jgi:hypothetical protein